MSFITIKQDINRACLEEAPTARFLQLEKEFAHVPVTDVPSYLRTVKAAFLSSFTIMSLSEVVRARGLLHNLVVSTYLAPYNQFTQELMSPQSEIHSFAPDCLYLLLDAPDILDAEHLDSIVRAATEIAPAVVVANFAHSPVSDTSRVHALNMQLTALAQELSFTIFDMAGFVQTYSDAWYTKYVSLGDLRVAPQRFPEWAEQLLAPLVSHTGVTRKCIVTDLDNTLWDGVVGEVGPQDVAPNEAYQDWLMERYAEGLILAINSKNNEADALEAFTLNDAIKLTKDHFAAWQINWQSKDQNIIALADELNIGTDSLVFIDDDPLQQRLVIESLPEVAVLSPETYQSFVGFTKAVITAEDKRKGVMYVEERKRRELQREMVDETAFLAKLDMRMHIRRLREDDISRVSQLTQKTNQYNLTTKRLQKHDVIEFMAKDRNDILLFEMVDAFGEYGVVGVGFLECVDSVCRIDNFMMSCRVIGRNAERAFLAAVVEYAKGRGLTTILGTFIASPKNQIARAFFSENGFLPVDSAEHEHWQRTVDDDFSSPDYISIITE